MRTIQLFFAAFAFDWLALSIAKSVGFLIAPWWLIGVMPIYTCVLAAFAVFAVIIFYFVFLVAKSIYLAHKKCVIENGISE